MAEGGNEKLDQVFNSDSKGTNSRDVLEGIDKQLRVLDEQIEDLSKLEKRYIEKLDQKFKEFELILTEIGKEDLDKSSRETYFEIQRSLAVLKIAFDNFKGSKGVEFEDKVATLNNKLLTKGYGLISWYEKKDGGVSPEDFKVFLETIPDGSLTRENIFGIKDLLRTLYHFCEFFGNGPASEYEWKIEHAFSQYMGDFLDVIERKMAPDFVFDQQDLATLALYRQYMNLPPELLSHVDDNSKRTLELLDIGEFASKSSFVQKLDKVENFSIYSDSLAARVFSEVYKRLLTADLVGSLIDKFKDDSFISFESWRYTIGEAVYSLKPEEKDKLLKKFKPKARKELQELFHVREFTLLTTYGNTYNDERHYNDFSEKTESDLWTLLGEIPDGSITEEHYYMDILSATQRYPTIQKMVVSKFANYSVSDLMLEQILRVVANENGDIAELFLVNYKYWTPEFFTKIFLSIYSSIDSFMISGKCLIDIMSQFPDGSISFDSSILMFLTDYFKVSEYPRFLSKLNQEKWLDVLKKQSNFKYQDHRKAVFNEVKYPDKEINELIYYCPNSVFDAASFSTGVSFKSRINSRDYLIAELNDSSESFYTDEVRSFILQLWDKYQKPLEEQQRYIGENLSDSLMNDPNYIVNLFTYDRPYSMRYNKPLYEGVFKKHSPKELSDIVSKGYQMRRNQLSAILAAIPYSQSIDYLNFACELMKNFPDQVNKKVLLSVVSSNELAADIRGYLLVFLEAESLELSSKALMSFLTTKPAPVVQHLMITVLKKMPYNSELQFLLSKEFFIDDTWAIFLADRLSKEYSNIQYFGEMMNLFSEVKSARDVLMENFRLHIPLLLEHPDEYGVDLTSKQELELKKSGKVSLPSGCNELCAALVVPYGSILKKPFLGGTDTLEEVGLDEKMKNLKILMNTYANPPSWMKSHEVESLSAKFIELMNNFNFVVHSLYMLGEENPDVLKTNNIPKNYYETVADKFLEVLPAEGYYFLLLAAKNNVSTSSVLMPTVFEDRAFPRFKKHLESFEGGLVGYLKKVDPSKKYWNEFVVYLISVGKLEEVFPEKKEDQQFIYDILFNTIQVSSNNIYTDLKNSVNNCHFILDVFNTLSGNVKYNVPLFEQIIKEYERVKVDHDKFPDDGIYNFNYMVLSVGIFNEYLAHVRPKVERKEQLSDLEKKIEVIGKEFEVKYLKYIEVARDKWLAEVKNEKKEVIQPKNVLRTIYYFWDKPQMKLTGNMLKAMGCVEIKPPECFAGRAEIEAYEAKVNGVKVQYILEFGYDHVSDDVKNNRGDNYSQRGTNSMINKFYGFKSNEQFYSFIGGCGSAGLFPQLSSKFSGAVFIGVVSTGHGGVNDIISHYINMAIAMGKKRWDEVQSYVIETLDKDLDTHKDIRTSDVGKIITKTHAKPYDQHKLSLFATRYYEKYRYPHQQLFLNIIRELMNGRSDGTLREEDLD